MPTGYTADVATGKVSDFREFAMQCARAFGALVTMRDAPHDAKVPETFEPSDFHVKGLEEAREKLAALQAMSSPEIEAAANEWHNAELTRIAGYNADKKAQEARYRTMIESVDAWVPPSPDHEEMKSFMRKQLTESIDFDCHISETPARLTPDDWWRKAIEQAEWDVNYHATEGEKEVTRAQNRTEWVRKLRDSLSQPEEPSHD